MLGFIILILRELFGRVVFDNMVDWNRFLLLEVFIFNNWFFLWLLIFREDFWYFIKFFKGVSVFEGMLLIKIVFRGIFFFCNVLEDKWIFECFKGVIIILIGEW